MCWYDLRSLYSYELRSYMVRPLNLNHFAFFTLIFLNLLNCLIHLLNHITHFFILLIFLKSNYGCFKPVRVASSIGHTSNKIVKSELCAYCICVRMLWCICVPYRCAAYDISKRRQVCERRTSVSFD